MILKLTYSTKVLHNLFLELIHLIKCFFNKTYLTKLYSLQNKIVVYPNTRLKSNNCTWSREGVTKLKSKYRWVAKWELTTRQTFFQRARLPDAARLLASHSSFIKKKGPLMYVFYLSTTLNSVLIFTFLSLASYMVT